MIALLSVLGRLNHSTLVQFPSGKPCCVTGPLLMDQRFWGLLAWKFLHDVTVGVPLCVQGYVCHEKGVGPKPVCPPQMLCQRQSTQFLPYRVALRGCMPAVRAADVLFAYVRRFIADFEKHCVDFVNNAVNPEGHSRERSEHESYALSL